MDIIISNASGKPIYEQITVQIKSQILSGALTAGDALPLSLIHIFSPVEKAGLLRHAACGQRFRPCSVSYTHLDVYKRQPRQTLWWASPWLPSVTRWAVWAAR